VAPAALLALVVTEALVEEAAKVVFVDVSMLELAVILLDEPVVIEAAEAELPDVDVVLPAVDAVLPDVELTAEVMEPVAEEVTPEETAEETVVVDAMANWGV